MISNNTTERQQPGDFDPAFNDGQLLTIPGEIAAAVVTDSAGKIYIAGAVATNMGGYIITALNPDGTRNRNFNNGESVIGDFMPDAYSMGMDIKILPDGKILLVGLTQSNSRGPIMLGLARYHPDGTLDQSFGVSGHLVPTYDYTNIQLPTFITEEDPTPDYVASNPRLSCIVDNGNIYVGLKGVHNRKNVTLIMHFDEGGYFIKEFGNNGAAVIEHPQYDTVLAQTLRIDQHLYLAGYLVSDQVGALRAWARVNTRGELDVDFGVDGFVFNNQSPGDIDKLVLQKNSKLLGCGGTGAREVVHFSNGVLASLNQDGTQDMDFNGGRPVIQPTVDNQGSFWTGCAIQSDAHIVTCGILTYAERNIIIGRHMPTGKPDTSFNDVGWKSIRLGKKVDRAAIALQSNNAIVVAGHLRADDASNKSFVFQLLG
ncbi:delta-60 repeat domain-containing protein [Pseudomonas mediterranea]|uniref:Delta-60 repeat domain-containing protein n=1 Tax=Pseudomonas mediterranea TaxID=183795 RepID=A0AAX2DJP5_9PSED|nr:delta-60 repeat domain-containing protein [Pseudomonas mediterranea]KGU84939.1 hypothetical protein N005_16450 [Pseudomonas mediterranea CFBP 5447]MBL0841048.1 delta-60 repeat domain-containing protein [Pseudomonas mediterranea]MDU9028424.1 delta-60 repeat domain-containing protein [Pseudomonas mediterranea]UZE02007.1 delta-60 repeat domain-containing protein [Pseudomonas mediterranea]CAH0180889.1 hypothetical protein SRABI112_01404 [Pseudomonas mediterranea]